MSRTKNTPLPPFRLSFSPGFILLASLVYLFDSQGLVPALVPSVAIHELGHILALILLGAPPRALNASLSGFSIDYVGELEPPGQLAAALSGPLAGAAFALLCARSGVDLESSFLVLTAGVSCGLSLFNLLPVFPLDGGRVLNAGLGGIFGNRVSRAVMRLLGLSIPCGLIILGVFIFPGPALPAAGAWLLANEILKGKRPRADRKEVL